MRPTTMTVADLKHLVASRLDVTEFLDILEWTMFDLVEVLDDAIEEHFDDLLEACDG
jgi:hypothetical protein